ncbi:MAG: beta-agarase [Planctomycetota bacterium]
MIKSLFVVFAVSAAPAFAIEPVTVSVDPTTLRQIDGIGELDRVTVFGMCDQGKAFDKRIDKPERMKFLLDDLNITFGRQLGPVNSVTNWGPGVVEDPKRPGFVDREALAKHLQADKPGDAFVRLTDGRLDVAAHGSHNAYPEFMGAYTTDQHGSGHKPQRLPENIDAAAELAALVMAHNYSDFDRPRYYEPVNEPFWTFYNTQHMADWHLRTKEAVQELSPDVLVGGPCSSVAYYYKRNFDAFNGFKAFMDNTGGELDFYSFHPYDYMHWDGEKIHGRVTTGMPLEGVIDLVQAYAVSEFGDEVDLVISEHGGYFNQGNRPGPHPVEAISDKYFEDGSGFEHEMKKRSIASHVLVSSALANTLVFMDHPHVVKKAVPFILLESMAWDPHYYSTLYVPYDFEDKSRWAESANLDFYRFFRDVQGHRVLVEGGSPDVQVRAFVDGDTLRIVLNNLSRSPEEVALDFPSTDRITVRRYTRQYDFTPSLTEEEVDSLDRLTLEGREAAIVIAEYPRELRASRTINEVPYYADQYAVKAGPGETAKLGVAVREPRRVVGATLRFGVTRPGDAGSDVALRVNGRRIELPTENHADRLTTEEEYGSTRIVELDPAILRERNVIEVGFPGDGGGAVGTAVIRAAYEVP